MKRMSLMAILITVLLILTGCAGPTFESLPLPGRGVSGDTITVSAPFDEALNLTDGAQVRVNGIDSGRVQSVTVKDFKALVVMKIRKSAGLRADAKARLRYTTPLGELFVQLDNPTTGAPMPAGFTMDPSHTSTAPTVEDALSSASMLINGGGLNQLKVITDESNNLLDGRQSTVRNVLDRGTSVITQLNASKVSIDRTLRSLNTVSKVLHERQATIKAALKDVQPASRAIRANLTQITTLLTQLRAFAATANDIVGKTKPQLLTIVREAGPLLQEIASIRSVLPATLQALFTVAKALDIVIPGDWLNIGVHLELAKPVIGTGAAVKPGGGLLGALNPATKGGLLGGLTSTLSGLTGTKRSTNSSPIGGLLGGLFGGKK